MNDLRSAIVTVADARALAERGAELIGEISRESLAARGRFTLALTGGSSPLGMYEKLATAPYRAHIDTTRTEFMFGDERAVPPTDDKSNYRAANEVWLSKVGALPENVHRMQGERSDLENAAREYEALVRERVPNAGGTPAFDLILLGIGGDAHVLSMYPQCPEITKPSALVVALRDPPMNPHVDRISFTRTLLESARCVMVIANGASKAEPLRALIEAPYEPLRIPAQMVRDVRARVIVLCDEAACAGLGR